MGPGKYVDRAAEWCKSEDPLKRARGADILAQLGKTVEHRSNSFPEESFAAISGLIQGEAETRPLISAISALGHLDDPSAVPLICPYEFHPDSEVRFAVACALGSFPNDPEAIDTLIRLTADMDDDVRDWATFGLGVLGGTDTIEIRDALAARLSDPSQDTREEAAVGLGKRKDRRVIPILTQMLSEPEPADRAVEAASLMLGMEQNETEMTAHDYISALTVRFGQ